MKNQKQCCRCRALKPLSAFSKKCDSADGYRRDCKACASAQNAEYRSLHPERVKERNAKNYAANKKARKEAARLYREQNRERLRAVDRESYRNNLEEHREYAKARYHKEKDRFRKERRIVFWRRNYGLSPLMFEALVEAQQGRCYICKHECHVSLNNQVVPHGSRWHVDHNHATGEVRGLLCHHCNSLLGHARDDPARLQAAIRYLLDPPAPSVLGSA